MSQCWSDQLFLHCVATGFKHIVQIPPCAFQGAGGRPWIFVSSSEAFVSSGPLGMFALAGDNHTTLVPASTLLH